MDIVGRLKWLIDTADAQTIFSIGPMLRGEKPFEMQKGKLVGYNNEFICASDISIWIVNGILHYKDKDGEKSILLAPEKLQELKDAAVDRSNEYLKFWGVI